MHPDAMTVRAHSVDLSCAFVGAGEPTLVVIPQWFLSSRSMRVSPLVVALARRHRLLLYDRRGTGASAKPGPPYTTGRDTRDLGALLDALGIEDVVVVGLGVRGSQVALMYGGHFPDRTRALIAVGGTPRWGAGPEWPYGISAAGWERAFGTLEGGGGEPPVGSGAGEALAAAIRRDWEDAGPAALDILRRTRDEDLRNWLGKVTPPTLVLHLAGDAYVPFQAARWLAESLPAGVLEVFEAPREIPFRAPEELADHIDEFLRVAGHASG